MAYVYESYFESARKTTLHFLKYFLCIKIRSGRFENSLRKIVSATNQSLNPDLSLKENTFRTREQLKICQEVNFELGGRGAQVKIENSLFSGMGDKCPHNPQNSSGGQF